MSYVAVAIGGSALLGAGMSYMASSEASDSAEEAARMGQEAARNEAAAKLEAQRQNNVMHWRSLGYTEEQLDPKTGLPKSSTKINTRFTANVDEEAMLQDSKNLYDQLRPPSYAQYQAAAQAGAPLRQGAIDAYGSLYSGEEYNKNVGHLDQQYRLAQGVLPNQVANVGQRTHDFAGAGQTYAANERQAIGLMDTARRGALDTNEALINDKYDQILQDQRLMQIQQGFVASGASNPYAVRGMFDASREIGGQRAGTSLATAQDYRNLSGQVNTQTMGDQRMGAGDAYNFRNLNYQLPLADAVARQNLYNTDANARRTAAPQSFALADSYVSQLNKPMQEAVAGQGIREQVMNPWAKAPTPIQQQGITPQFVPNAPDKSWANAAGALNAGMSTLGAGIGLFSQGQNAKLWGESPTTPNYGSNSYAYNPNQSMFTQQPTSYVGGQTGGTNPNAWVYP